MPEVQTPSIIEKIFATEGPEVVVAPPVVKPTDDTKDATPPMYAVILHNDGTTTPEFVTHVLQEAFKVEGRHAYNVMLAAHRSGHSTVQIVTKEVAETRVANAEAMIAGAQAGTDHVNRGPCELRFSIEQETKGEG